MGYLNSESGLADFVSLRKELGGQVEEPEFVEDGKGLAIRAMAFRETNAVVRLQAVADYRMGEPFSFGSYVRTNPYRLRTDGTTYVMETQLTLLTRARIHVESLFLLGFLFQLLPSDAIVEAGPLRLAVRPLRRVEVSPGMVVGHLYLLPVEKLEEVEVEEEEKELEVDYDEMTKKTLIELAFNEDLGTMTELSRLKKDELIEALTSPPEDEDEDE